MKYHLANDGVKYWTGVGADGAQFIIGPALPNIEVYQFASSGRFVRKQTIPLRTSPQHDTKTGIYVTDGNFIAGMESEISDLMLARGIVAGPIDVEAFLDEDGGAGIKALPDEYEEFLNDPTGYSLEERNDLEESLKRFTDAGRFIFIWGSEHWMSAEGEVDSW